MAKKEFDRENPYQSGAQLQRDEMIALTLTGGSVVYGNRLIENPNHVPDAGTLAKTAAARAQVKIDVEAEIAKLQEQLTQLQGTTTIAEPGPLPEVAADGSSKAKA